MNNQQILFAIEKFPANLETAINVICDIYCLDYSKVLDIVQNEHGPLYDNTPLLK